ncbi:hypothetical protein SAY86_017960 [Trapa natans]|uniref:EF-1-gamma C-terminal domain-containing protein n=1 Tax=Trapa natans TaxID=22666 RepID=A0AAN7M617_TRANT|nr:hypothetical protein SAY86_017960 [Trapa natans]
MDLFDEVQKECVNQMIEDAEPFEEETLVDAKCFKLYLIGTWLLVASALMGCLLGALSDP